MICSITHEEYDEKDNIKITINEHEFNFYIISLLEWWNKSNNFINPYTNIPIYSYEEIKKVYDKYVVMELNYEKFENNYFKIFENEEKKYYLDFVRNYLKGEIKKFNKHWFNFTAPYFLPECYLCNKNGIMDKEVEKHTINLFEYSIIIGDINLFNIILKEIDLSKINHSKPLEYAIFQSNLYIIKELIKRGIKLTHYCQVYNKFVTINKFIEEYRPYLFNSFK